MPMQTADCDSILA